MGLKEQSSLSKFIRKPFKKKKKSKSLSDAAEPVPGGAGAVSGAGETVTANASCSPGSGCARCGPLETRVTQLSAELRELRTELAALKGTVATLHGPRAASRHRRDSFESCWDASSLRFYAAHEVLVFSHAPASVTTHNQRGRSLHSPELHALCSAPG